MKAFLGFILIFVPYDVHAKKGSPADFIATLYLTEEHVDDAFSGLDPLYTDKINQNDLKKLYYYGDSEFAEKKFIELINKDALNDISQTEIGDFLRKQPVTNAVWECTYVTSKSLRQFCFADQILTHVYLVLNQDAIRKFFKSIHDPKNGEEVIKLDEVKKLITLNEKFTEKEALNFMKEVGGDDEIITIEEFNDYVSQEGLLYEFRVCRTNVVDSVEEYDNECMKKSLIYWTMNHVTELDITAVFSLFEDDNDNGFDLTVEDLKKVASCNEETAKKFVKLMDKTKDKRVSYAEFRTYIKSPLVKLHLEKDCAHKYINKVEAVECYKKEVLKRVEEFHTLIWLSLLDLDMIFTFEELGTTKDGQISVEDDLIIGHKWPKDIATKMLNEMDGPDPDNNISLDEFHEYVNWPNIIYGLADCQVFSREIKRINCYTGELKKNMELMVEKTKVDDFYKFYDKDGNGYITRKEVEATGVTGEDLQNFIDEMGMGDETITYDELKWYVRQEELSKMFKGCKNIPDLHETLLKYLKTVFTEYNTQQIFVALDVSGNCLLERSEFMLDSKVFHGLIQRVVPLDDKDTIVNFLEFWIYWHTPIGTPRKGRLEEECTKEHNRQAKKIDCYKTSIKEIKIKEKQV